MVTSSAVVGLVAEQDFRVAGQRDGEDGPLPHAAGELVGYCLYRSAGSEMPTSRRYSSVFSEQQRPLSPDAVGDGLR